MKTTATIFFIFFIGMSAQAQNNTTALKVETIETTIIGSSPKVVGFGLMQKY
jgi:hypothetical protein